MAVIDSIYVPNLFGRTSFPLQHQGYPLFYKKFNASDEDVVDTGDDLISIENHFFKTGEPLRYIPLNGGSPISINPASPGASGITTLPEIFYPIVIGRDTFRVALSKDLAFSNSYVDITAVGIGTLHTIETFKNNAKCLITIDNIIQSPASVKSAVGITSTNPNNSLKISLGSIDKVKVGTILRIGQEYSRVTTINYTPNQYGYEVLLTRGIEVLGSDALEDISGISTAYVMGGVYNINKGKIYFSSPPLEGNGFSAKIDLNNIDYNNNSFTIFTSDIDDGSQVLFFSRTPPLGLESGKVYFIIKNFENNFSFGLTFVDVTNKNKVNFDQRGAGDLVAEFEVIEVTSRENSSFQGRAFLKSNYDGNAVFDDISSSFNGITTSFGLKISGVSTVGIKSDNGVVLINDIFQYPESEESFYYEESGGSTNIVWNGSVFPDLNSGITSVKDYDVNVRGLPRGGIIVGYGLSAGINYQTLTRAEGHVSLITPEGNFSVDPNGITDSISIGYSGSGYIQGITTYYVYFQDSSGNRVAGLGTAIIEDGKVSKIGIIENVPEGTYAPDLSDKPYVYIDAPFPYDNIRLTGSVNGIGASCSFDINSDGIVNNFRINNPGYGYSVGEILSPVVSVGNTSQIELDKLKVIVTETNTDNFSAWNLGRLRKLNDLSQFANGTRKTFTLKETINDQVNIISLEKLPGSEIELAYNLLIFVNDILQIPGQSYNFTRGTKVRFTEAPPRGSSIKVYFYEGYTGDSILSDAEETVKKGDKLEIQKDLYNSIPKRQFSRTVTDILSSDEVETEIYNRRGLSFNSDQFRAITWTPQKQDLIIGGEYVSKSRRLNKSRVGIFTGIGQTNGTFVGASTNFIGLNTSIGLGIQIGDYIESSYTGVGVTVVSIGSSVIGIGKTQFSSSPVGIATTTVTVWRKIDVE
jgi:hypothetical protein